MSIESIERFPAIGMGSYSKVLVSFTIYSQKLLQLSCLEDKRHKVHRLKSTRTHPKWNSSVSPLIHPYLLVYIFFSRFFMISNSFPYRTMLYIFTIYLRSSRKHSSHLYFGLRVFHTTASSLSFPSTNYNDECHLPLLA